MSQSRELQAHIKQLEEIRSILNAMKNLAFMAVHKLTQLQALQTQIVTHIEHNAVTFLTAYPIVNIEYKPQPVYIVIGSERGFCGDFNDSLLNHLPPDANIIAIGSRLIGRIESYTYQVIASLMGANAEEEIPLLLEQLLEQLANTDHQTLIVVYHDVDNNQIQQRQILPAFTQLKPNQNSETPILNLTPAQFFSELLEQYVPAVLYEIFYSSLLTENRIRLQHLEGAVQHLDDQTSKLHRKAQQYRQEEITEEIEVILLNTEQF
ncbi:F-type H+-transporting ATPase subunit gamma [Anaerolineae bacterium]|nr:F-type H+-transporting ATPase subunit gamma [Anaerolineae bacterium]